MDLPSVLHVCGEDRSAVDVLVNIGLFLTGLKSCFSSLIALVFHFYQYIIIK